MAADGFCRCVLSPFRNVCLHHTGAKQTRRGATPAVTEGCGHGVGTSRMADRAPAGSWLLESSTVLDSWWACPTNQAKASLESTEGRNVGRRSYPHPPARSSVAQGWRVADYITLSLVYLCVFSDGARVACPEGWRRSCCSSEEPSQSSIDRKHPALDRINHREQVCT